MSEETTAWITSRAVRMILGAAAGIVGSLGAIFLPETIGTAIVVVFAGGALFGQAHG